MGLHEQATVLILKYFKHIRKQDPYFPQNLLRGVGKTESAETIYTKPLSLRNLLFIWLWRIATPLAGSPSNEPMVPINQMLSKGAAIFHQNDVLGSGNFKTLNILYAYVFVYIHVQSSCFSR
jgi:hypothetical protein